jgi:hypothetical protein
MLTIDDVRSIPLFSTLAASELERLAETSADLLSAGEFAVHEGDDRALYAVLAGKLEVTGSSTASSERWAGAFGHHSAKCRSSRHGVRRRISGGRPSRVFRVIPSRLRDCAARAVKHVASAVGEGSMAIAVHRYLQRDAVVRCWGYVRTISQLRRAFIGENLPGTISCAIPRHRHAAVREL